MFTDAHTQFSDNREMSNKDDSSKPSCLLFRFLESKVEFILFGHYQGRFQEDDKHFMVRASQIDGGFPAYS